MCANPEYPDSSKDAPAITRQTAVAPPSTVAKEETPATFQSIYEMLSDEIGQTLDVVFGLDFSHSNMSTWEGVYSGPMHDTSYQNPYLHAMQLLQRVVEKFETYSVAAYRFGCKQTCDKSILPLNAEKAEYESFEDLFADYKKQVDQIEMAGPTTFGPFVSEVISRMEQKRPTLAVIITDGNVSDSHLDREELTRASSYPIAFLVLEVGSGPFENLDFFLDQQGDRRFVNYNVVNFTREERIARDQKRDEAFLLNRTLQGVPQLLRDMVRVGVAPSAE